MTKPWDRLILLTFALGTLSGCQSIFSSNFGDVSVASEQVDLGGYFAQRLAEGRGHLQADRPGAAISAYRQASYDPDLRATAFNGMAVAYDRLGRADLAQRYFMAAIELEPDNVSFATNFVRFTENRVDDPTSADVLALAFAGDGTAEVDDHAALDRSGIQVGEATAISGSIRRLSPREVHIASQSNAEGSTPRSERPAVISVARRSESDSEEPARYPIRIVLSEVGADASRGPAAERNAAAPQRPARRSRPPVPAAIQQKGYPIRIYLRDS